MESCCLAVDEAFSSTSASTSTNTLQWGLNQEIAPGE
jgi:hypothetical protein